MDDDLEIIDLDEEIRQKKLSNISKFVLGSFIFLNTALVSYFVISKLNPYEKVNKSFIAYNSEDLSEYYDKHDVTFDDLKNVVGSNKNLTELEVLYLNMYIDGLSYSIPNGDYRLFYENLKTVDIKYVNESALDDRVAAYYDSSLNTIFIDRSYRENKYVLYHEITHLLNVGYMVKGDEVIVKRFEKDDTTIDEGFTDYISLCVMGKPNSGAYVVGYPFTRCFARLICNSSLDFSVDDFTKKDTEYLINLLNKELPNFNSREMFKTISNVQSDLTSGKEIDKLELEKSFYYMFSIYMLDKPIIFDEATLASYYMQFLKDINMSLKDETASITMRYCIINYLQYYEDRSIDSCIAKRM